MTMKELADAGYEIVILDPEEIVSNLDGSTDLPDSSGMEYFDDLMIEKYQGIPPRLFDDLEQMGIEKPILISIDEDGLWIFADGHHRLAWALVHKQPVPILFVDEAVDATEIWLILEADTVYYDYS